MATLRSPFRVKPAVLSQASGSLNFLLPAKPSSSGTRWVGVHPTCSCRLLFFWGGSTKVKAHSQVLWFCLVLSPILGACSPLPMQSKPPAWLSTCRIQPLQRNPGSPGTPTCPPCPQLCPAASSLPPPHTSLAAGVPQCPPARRAALNLPLGGWISSH